MKKIIYSISVLLTSVFFTRNANAIWPDFTPVIPFAPQFCVMCVPPAISVAISYYDQAIEVKEDLEKYTDMTTLKQMAAAYVSKMGTTAFNYWRQNKNTRTRGVAYARTIEDSKIADMQDEASVKKYPLSANWGDFFFSMLSQQISDRLTVLPSRSPRSGPQQ